MPTRNNILPIELWGIVFHYIAIQDTPVFRPPDRTSQLPDVLYLNMFPLNIASVCTLWLQILKSRPHLWQRVLINVASNPAPFLDTLNLFTSSSTDTLDLIVFSNYPSINKDLEHSRTRLVVEHLVPVIHRYSRIIFRLVYQSSLPSSTEILVPRAPQNLRKLFLTCTTYDICDDDVDDCDHTGIEGYTPFLSSIIPTYLNELSLTGFDFMHYVWLGPFKHNGNMSSGYP